MSPWQLPGRKRKKILVRAVSAESIYCCMLLFFDHILYHRAHFICDMLMSYACYQVSIFLISLWKHVLLVLIRSVSAILMPLMSTYSICFRGEIRKTLILLDWKKAHWLELLFYNSKILSCICKLYGCRRTHPKVNSALRQLAPRQLTSHKTCPKTKTTHLILIRQLAPFRRQLASDW